MSLNFEQADAYLKEAALVKRGSIIPNYQVFYPVKTKSVTEQNKSVTEKFQIPFYSQLRLYHMLLLSILIF